MYIDDAIVIRVTKYVFLPMQGIPTIQCYDSPQLSDHLPGDDELSFPAGYTLISIGSLP